MFCVCFFYSNTHRTLLSVRRDISWNRAEKVSNKIKCVSMCVRCVSGIVELKSIETAKECTARMVWRRGDGGEDASGKRGIGKMGERKIFIYLDCC